MFPGEAILYMLVIGTTIALFKMPILFGTTENKVNLHLNAIYLALFTVCAMSLARILMFHSNMSYEEFLLWIVILTTSIIVLWYMISKQIFVNENQYYKAILEHHITTLELSKKILNKKNISNTNKKIIEEIIKNEENEINKIKQLLISKD